MFNKLSNVSKRRTNIKIESILSHFKILITHAENITIANREYRHYTNLYSSPQIPSSEAIHADRQLISNLKTAGYPD